MADDTLEHMLLAAAGRKSGGATSSSNSKRRVASSSRPGGASSSASSASGSSSSSDDDDDAAKKHAKVPLKKRFDGGSGDRDGDDGSGSDLSFGSDLYKDDEDKRNLEAMTELQREMILHERSEKRDNYSLKKSTEARIAQEERERKRGDGPPPSSRMRSSGRETSKTSKTNALSELVAKRQRSQDASQHQQQQQQQQQQRKRRNAEGAPPRRSASPSSNSDADSDEDDEESSRGESNRSDVPSDDDNDDKGGRPSLPDNEDIRKITIRRSKLWKWFMEPFFEEVIVGCFVRIGIGVSSSGASMYRLCLVKNVDAKEPDKHYKFENRTTYKYLNCSWGDDSSARWQMVRASDQPPTDEEIDAWKAEVAKSGSPGIGRLAVKDKFDALEKVSSFVYSAAAVKQMLQEKKLASARPSNLALEKERVLKELGVAQGKGDHEQVERLQDKLKELDSLAPKQQFKNEKAERIEMMNRRNRFENFKNASELKPVNSSAKMGEAGYDPFSRRWTRSQNYYRSDAPKTAAEEQGEATGSDKAGKDGAGLLQELNKAGSGRLAGRQYSKMFNLHDFDLPISLAAMERLKSGQGAPVAFMERKRKMEARYGVRVDSDDGRRHSLTLTVNDYKRRRGLL